MKIAPVTTTYTAKYVINNSQRNNAVSFKWDYTPTPEDRWTWPSIIIGLFLCSLIMYGNVRAAEKDLKSKYYKSLMELVDNKCYHHPNSDGGVIRTDAEIKQRNKIYNLIDSLTKDISYVSHQRTKIEQVQNDAIYKINLHNSDFFVPLHAKRARKIITICPVHIVITSIVPVQKKAVRDTECVASDFDKHNHKKHGFCGLYSKK